MARPSFTIGIEEEYLIVDPETRDLVRDLPAGLMAQIEGILGKQVAPEFLRSQIEVGTVVSENIGQAGPISAGCAGPSQTWPESMVSHRSPLRLIPLPSGGIRSTPTRIGTTNSPTPWEAL